MCATVQLTPGLLPNVVLSEGYVGYGVHVKIMSMIFTANFSFLP